MRALNPVGRVPAVILDDGEVLVDSWAILDWLDETVGPERALLPPSGPARRRALQLVAHATGAADKAIQLAYETILRPAEHRWADWVERCRLQALTAMDALEREVRRDQGWLGGERIGQADITTACMLGYCEIAVPDLVLPDRHPALRALGDRCDGLEAFRATKPAAYVVPKAD